MRIVKCRTIYVANASSYFRNECDYDVSAEGETREEAEEKVIEELLRITILPSANPDIEVSTYRILEVEETQTVHTEFKSEPIYLGSRSAQNHPKVVQSLIDRIEKQKEENKKYQESKKAERLRIYEEVRKEMESQS